jgi:hypothetical protein
VPRPLAGALLALTLIATSPAVADERDPAVVSLALAGPLPPPLQARLAYAAALLAGSRTPDGSRAFLSFLATPATRTLLARPGLEQD